MSAVPTWCRFAGTLVLLLMCGATARAQPCAPPETVVFGDDEQQLVFSRDGRARGAPLEEIDFLARAKQSLGILVPGIMLGEFRVHLYSVAEAAFLSRYSDIEETDRVRFYVVCERNGAYTAAPGTVSRQPAQPTESADAPEEGIFIGLTLRPAGTTPEVTLKGNVAAFRMP